KNILGIGGGLGLAGMLDSCNDAPGVQHIKARMLGAAHQTGHLLRTPGKIPAPTEQMQTGVLIAGGGITGLSAMRWLRMHGLDDALLLEMDNRPGGNSVYGSNEVSAYPWAAHYLPVPDAANAELLDFLRAIGTIKGEEKGLPVYNEYHICHDPEERLFINGHWQEGIVPAYGIGEADRQEIERFFALVAEWKAARGSDGLYAFAIP